MYTYIIQVKFHLDILQLSFGKCDLQNDFLISFSSGSITAWKAFDIGCGVVKSALWKKPHLPTLTTIQDFTPPQEVVGDAVGTRSKTTKETFPCPEDCCSFQAGSFSELEQHITVGLHSTVKRTTQDQVALKWAARVEDLATRTKDIHKPATSSSSMSSDAPKG